MPVLSKKDISDSYEIYFEKAVYSSLNLDVRALPPRSKLFSLPPINVGTSSVESLLSYFARLAFEYLVSPSTLLKHAVNESSVSPELTKSLRLSKKMSGMSFNTEVLNEILQQLTQRTDLYFTTLLAFKGKIHPIDLLKKKRVWCSLCFAEQLNNLGLNYEKLIWTVEPVEQCSQHQIYLESKCSNCSEEPKILSMFLRPGHCSNCFRWLGDRQHLKLNGQNLDVNNKTKKEGFEEIIAQSNLLRAAHGKSKFRANLADCIGQLAHGSVVEFSHIVRIQSYQISHLLEGDKPPTWQFLINISNALEIPVIDLLTTHPLKLPKKEVQYNSSYQFNYIR